MTRSLSPSFWKRRCSLSTCFYIDLQMIQCYFSKSKKLLFDSKNKLP